MSFPAKKAALWLAQGFGVGRVPVAPGTWGSLVGLGWFALLLVPRSPALACAGAVSGFLLSVWLSGMGERMLGKKDPGSVVIDEIAAMPACFGSWLALFAQQHRAFPGPGEVFLWGHGALVVSVFLAFRAFDVLKPWPVRQSQCLRGGWGITIDDFLAALYVNLLVVAVHTFRPLV